MSKKGIRPPSIQFFVFFPKTEDPNIRPMWEDVTEAKYTVRRNMKRFIGQQMRKHAAHCFFAPPMLPENRVEQQPQVTQLTIQPAVESNQTIAFTSEPTPTFTQFFEEQEDEFFFSEQDHIGECGIASSLF